MTEPRAVPKLVCAVAAMVKPVFCVVLGYPVGCRSDTGFQRFAGAGPSGAQPRFKFTKGQFDGVEVRRVGRQVAQPRSAGCDQFGQAGHLMNRQVIEHDHVAGHQRGTEHLLEVSGKYHPVDDPAHRHGRLQARAGQRRNQRHVWPAVPGRGLAGAPPALGADVTTKISPDGAGLVHALKPRKILRLQRFHKGTPKGYDPPRVALGGVNALFFRRQSNAGTAPLGAAMTCWPMPLFRPSQRRTVAIY